MTTGWIEYLKNEELKYKNLGCVVCPAFNNEEIYFNNYGLHHLIYKGEKLRTKNEIARRFKLLPYVLDILKIIIRRLNNGTLHFFSVMSE